MHLAYEWPYVRRDRSQSTTTAFLQIIKTWQTGLKSSWLWTWLTIALFLFLCEQSQGRCLLGQLSGCVDLWIVKGLWTTGPTGHESLNQHLAPAFSLQRQHGTSLKFCSHKGSSPPNHPQLVNWLQNVSQHLKENKYCQSLPWTLKPMSDFPSIACEPFYQFSAVVQAFMICTATSSCRFTPTRETSGFSLFLYTWACSSCSPSLAIASLRLLLQHKHTSCTTTCDDASIAQNPYTGCSVHVPSITCWNWCANAINHPSRVNISREITSVFSRKCVIWAHWSAQILCMQVLQTAMLAAQTANSSKLSTFTSLAPQVHWVLPTLYATSIGRAATLVLTSSGRGYWPVNLFNKIVACTYQVSPGLKIPSEGQPL